jgi:hypothetical protein
VAVDASANVYVIGRLNPPFGSQAVEEILAAGGYTTVNTLGGSLTNSHAVAAGASGTLYIAEPAGIVEVQPDGANFGAANVKTASSVLSLVFTFATGGTLGSTAVLTQAPRGWTFPMPAREPAPPMEPATRTRPAIPAPSTLPLHRRGLGRGWVRCS